MNPPTAKPVTFTFGANEQITVEPFDLHSTISREGTPNSQWDAAVDSGESLLLAMASAGIPMDTPEMREAVETWMERISDEFGED